MQTYRVSLYAALFALMVAVLTVFGIFMFFTTIREAPAGSPFILGWLGLVGFFWFKLLRTPLSLHLSSDGVLKIRGVLKSHELQASELTAVSSKPLMQGMTIFHRSGQIDFMFPLTDALDLTDQLRRLNPGLLLHSPHPLKQWVEGEWRTVEPEEAPTIRLTESKVYKISEWAYLFAGFTLLFTLALFAGYLFSETSVKSDLLPGFAILLWFWFNVLNSPYQVRLEPDQSVLFKSLIRTKRIGVLDLNRIQGMPFNFGWVIRHNRGLIWMRVEVNDFLDLVTRLRLANPQLRVTGI